MWRSNRRRIVGSLQGSSAIAYPTIEEAHVKCSQWRYSRQDAEFTDRPLAVTNDRSTHVDLYVRCRSSVRASPLAPFILSFIETPSITLPRTSPTGAVATASVTNDGSVYDRHEDHGARTSMDPGDAREVAVVFGLMGRAKHTQNRRNPTRGYAPKQLTRGDPEMHQPARIRSRLGVTACRRVK